LRNAGLCSMLSFQGPDTCDGQAYSNPLLKRKRSNRKKDPVLAGAG